MPTNKYISTKETSTCSAPRTMGTGDRLAVDEEENLILELGVRLHR